MVKWADYGISEVSYDRNRKHIERLKVHIDDGETMGNSQIWLRSEVVSSLENEESFVTITKSDGKWHRGANVQIIERNGVKYLKTVADNTEKDNLGDLSEF